MEGWVDLGGWLYTEMVHVSAAVTTWQRPDCESNPRSCDRKSNILTVTSPSQHSKFTAVSLVPQRNNMQADWHTGYSYHANDHTGIDFSS